MANNIDQFKADKRAARGRDIESTDDIEGKQAYPQPKDDTKGNVQVRPGQPLPASHPGKKAQDEAATNERTDTKSPDWHAAVGLLGDKNINNERGY